MRSGKFLERHLADARKGDPVALAKVLSRPELTEEAEPYFAAFLAVTRDRPIAAGMGGAIILPVPSWAIEMYLRRVGVDEIDIAEDVEILAAIDDGYVRLQAEITAAEAAKNTKGG